MYRSRRDAARRTLLAAATAAALALTLPAAGGPPAVAQDEAQDAAQPSFLVGRGVGDVTGEVAEVGLLGYADLAQTGTGLHTRQRSRAFVVADAVTGERVVLVVADVGMVFQSVRDAVLARLAQRFGDTYGEHNVLLTATHTHAGPGGHSHHTLYNLTTLGFHPETFEATVDGIVDSVVEAHDDLAPATLSLARTELTDASANRSRVAFDANPAADRAHFPTGTDTRSTTLRVERDGDLAGAVNWFATHATSMPTTNRLVSADNKGYAAYHWEEQVAGVDHLAGDDPDLVTAFAQTNAGDMSPNLALRPGTGPTDDPRENTRLIGLRQYRAAADATATPMTRGGVDARTVYVDLSDVTVRPEFTGDGRTHRTCAAALGASFAAGSTEDGGGGLPIVREGGNPAFGWIADALYTGSPALRECQAPKEVLLPVGALDLVQQELPVQVLRIGDLHLVAVPAEVTVVAGLRLRRTLADALDVDVDDVLVQGYANGYAHYLTTPEEYDLQQYEGGSTLFGRWQLPAFQQVVHDLAVAVRDDAPADLGSRPADRSGRVVTSPAGRVVWDAPPLGRRFGDVVAAPPSTVPAGTTVTVAFAGAHPNTVLRRDGTYAAVEQLVDGRWVRVADDGDWSTRFTWSRWGLAASRVTVEWDVPADAAPGSYRVVYTGDARGLLGHVRPVRGATAPFTVTG
ncbi:neutral/alkaline ceramidase [Thalassiella azotivora]